MIDELLTYSLQDFIPFTESVYWRLFEDMNASNVYLFTLLTLVALGAIRAAQLSRPIVVAACLAGLWAWVGYDFFWTRYAQLNWAGEYFAWAFWVQSALMIGGGFLDRQKRQVSGMNRASIFLVAVAYMFPLFAPLTGRSLESVELVGMAPDPTVVLTLGLLLTAQKTRLWLLFIPTLWCLASGATAWVLGYWPGLLMPILALVACVVAVLRNRNKE